MKGSGDIGIHLFCSAPKDAETTFFGRQRFLACNGSSRGIHYVFMLVFSVGEACNWSVVACFTIAKTRKQFNLLTYGQSNHVL